MITAWSAASAKCGTVQFPQADVCVNPNCNAIDTQEPYAFADMAGRIMSYTADWLTYSPDPPAYYGMITFAEGGRFMTDFTDIDEDEVKVGADAHDVPHPRHRHRARLQALLLEGGAGRGARRRRLSSRRETAMARGIKDKVAILGMGCSKFGERWDSGAEELMLEAYKEASPTPASTPSRSTPPGSRPPSRRSTSASRRSRCRSRCACPTSR